MTFPKAKSPVTIDTLLLEPTAILETYPTVFGNCVPSDTLRSQ